MLNIRVRTSIRLNGNHAISDERLKNEIKPAIERAIAQNLPADIAVDQVQVTRINGAKEENAE